MYFHPIKLSGCFAVGVIPSNSPSPYPDRLISACLTTADGGSSGRARHATTQRFGVHYSCSRAGHQVNIQHGPTNLLLINNMWVFDSELRLHH